MWRLFLGYKQKNIAFDKEVVFPCLLVYSDHKANDKYMRASAPVAIGERACNYSTRGGKKTLLKREPFLAQIHVLCSKLANQRLKKPPAESFLPLPSISKVLHACLWFGTAALISGCLISVRGFILTGGFINWVH